MKANMSVILEDLIIVQRIKNLLNEYYYIYFKCCLFCNKTWSLLNVLIGACQ